MKRPVQNKPFTWSPSSLKAFYTCPVQYWAKYCDPNRKKEPDSEAMIWGKEVHKAFELALKHDDRVLPDRFKQYQKWYGSVKAINAFKEPEKKVAFNRFWEQTEFFAPDAWLRLVVDVTGKAKLRDGEPTKGIVLDYKTGKSRYDNNDQLMLSGLQFLDTPSIEWMQAGYIYLKEDHSTYMEATREQMEGWKLHFERKLEPVVEAYTTGIFTPKPSGLCKKWCNVRSCAHCGK